MGLFSFKKKPKEEKPGAAPAQAAQPLPSLGLPENKPVPVKPGAPAAVPAATPAPAPVAAAPVPTAVADSVPLATKLAAQNTAEPEVYVLPEVKLEETGFIEAPGTGTGSVSLVVGLPDAEVPKPASTPTPAPAVAADVPATVAAPDAAAPSISLSASTPEASPSISLTAPTPETAPAISLASPDSAQPAIAIAAPVTSIAEPGTPSGVVAPGATPAPEFKPPNVAAAPSVTPAPGATPSPEGLKSQVLPARAFRVVISALHRLKFRPAEPILKGAEEARLSNISTSGVGLVATDFIRPPAMKSVISGHLVFESGSHPVQLEVMHVTSGVIGCKFGGEKVEGLREAIKAYFELELLALGMLKVNPAHHKAEADGNAHWIHGDQCELFYVTDAANKLVRFRLTFLGNRFVWTKSGGLNLGQVIDDRVGIMRTDRIAVMEATPEISELALRFLHNIPQVPQEHRDQIGNAISPGYVLKPEPPKAA